MASVPSTAVPPLPIARFSVEQYHRMIVRANEAIGIHVAGQDLGTVPVPALLP